MDEKYIEIIFKIVVPILTTIFGLYQIRKRYDLERILKMKSWNLHKHTALLLGDVQRAKDSILQNKTNEALVFAGISEGQAQALLKESALLVCHYEAPSYSKIDQWVNLGEIDAGYKHMFLPFASDDNCILRLIRCLKHEKNNKKAA